MKLALNIALKVAYGILCATFGVATVYFFVIATLELLQSVFGEMGGILVGMVSLIALVTWYIVGVLECLAEGQERQKAMMAAQGKNNATA
jgi:hypothetical protein